MSTVLWQPSAARIADANMTAFGHYVQARFGLQLPDYAALHAFSIEQRERFWTSLWDFAQIVARDKGEQVLVDGDRMPGAHWFPQARLNFAENLLAGRQRVWGERGNLDPERPVILFQGEDKVRTELSFRQLHEQVSVLAQAMRAAGLRPGDRVAAYLPNMPETIIGMLAATSLGAIWSSCSPDFGARGVLDRFGQIEPRLLLCVDGYYYAGKTHDTLDKTREIIAALPSVEQVVLVPYVDPQAVEQNARALSDKAVSLAAFVADYAPRDIEFEQLPFEHPLYILYSSGTTGVPKCIVHGAGGTLLQHMKEHLLHTDIKPGDRLFYFTTTGWMMWNWLVSGLASGATLVLFDGSPFHPDASVLFDLADRVGIDVFGTSAKYIDAVKKSGLVPRESNRLDELRAILSTGSPLVPESFDFVYDSIKTDVCLSSVSGGTDIVS
ncbi:MAG: acetoacetate--CoA ligase, partial [Gammaproteobacteria bacterium]|nr:acetoacetate--CoA ligase [Gammaproteobacteria bacterium]